MYVHMYQLCIAVAKKNRHDLAIGQESIPRSPLETPEMPKLGSMVAAS